MHSCFQQSTKACIGKKFFLFRTSDFKGTSPTRSECGRDSIVWLYRFFDHFLPASRFRSWRLSSKSSELKYTLLAEDEIVLAISRAASIFLSVMKAGLLAIAWPISCALLASPCALIIALRLSCSAFSTMNLALSASCAATCFASMAAVNSRPKVRLVIDTSSSAMLKLAALSLWVMSWLALYWATTAFKVS
nr:hypothetical protein F751_3886 [Ipomoea batatas]